MSMMIKIANLEIENKSLRQALNRQTENMAFVLNHIECQDWYGKFAVDLDEDRELLE